MWGGELPPRIAVPLLEPEEEDRLEFTDTQAEILVNAWLLAREGKGQVLEDWAEPDAERLREAAWLEQRTEPDGPSSWWWTPEAEAALDLNTLKQSVEDRQN
jgi:hypothetical protein